MDTFEDYGGESIRRILGILLILLLMEIIGMITFLILTKNPGEHAVLSIRGIPRLLCVLGMLSIQLLTGWLLFFTPMKPVPVTGTYHIATRDSFYTDSCRLEAYASDGSYRELPVTFLYPEAYDCERYGKCPLVIFSHGSTGVRDSNIILYRELVSHGYIVCTIDHPYQCISTTLSSGKKVKLSGDFLKELQKEDPHTNPDVSDIVALIDSDRICVMGHSLGGSAALGVGRHRSDIRAVIALEAAFLHDVRSLNDAGHFVMDSTDYPVPVLNIYSDATWSQLNEWEQYAENVRLLSKESDTIRNYYISGVGHIGLTDLSMTTPFITTLIDGGMTRAPQDTLKQINEQCLDFLETVMR